MPCSERDKFSNGNSELCEYPTPITNFWQQLTAAATHFRTMAAMMPLSGVQRSPTWSLFSPRTDKGQTFVLLDSMGAELLWISIWIAILIAKFAKFSSPWSVYIGTYTHSDCSGLSVTVQLFHQIQGAKYIPEWLESLRESPPSICESKSTYFAYFAFLWANYPLVNFSSFKKSPRFAVPK